MSARERLLEGMGNAFAVGSRDGKVVIGFQPIPALDRKAAANLVAYVTMVGMLSDADVMPILNAQAYTQPGQPFVAESDEDVALQECVRRLIDAEEVPPRRLAQVAHALTLRVQALIESTPATHVQKTMSSVLLLLAAVVVDRHRRVSGH